MYNINLLCIIRGLLKIMTSDFCLFAETNEAVEVKSSTEMKDNFKGMRLRLSPKLQSLKGASYTPEDTMHKV